MKEITYTHEQLEIALLKQKCEDINKSFNYLYRSMDRIESMQRWNIFLIAAQSLELLLLIAHELKWII